jgi:hypothetical protein
MDLSAIFRMPMPMSIVARSSTITNSFVNSIIPVIEPTEAEILEALRILEMSPTDVRCAYCGDPFTEWDHLRPLVKDRRPTGYLSEIGNLVPACGKCNQSKGNKNWRVWIDSGADRSPRTRGVPDLEKRIELLTQYEKWKPREPINFESAVGPELWREYWESWQEVLEVCRTSQEIARRIRVALGSNR